MRVGDVDATSAASDPESGSADALVLASARETAPAALDDLTEQLRLPDHGHGADHTGQTPNGCM
jgi:hypothetical protein